ncbi:XRE family transcriptional regulator [Psychrobacillus lasiicapitis]|uniref:Helix-turn-helix domain-containing protein n=1 Tax=Psychrobacillus lasiicapitis TaxID=1636719 RepID=A0A544TA64_9BACI|nr:LexA family transcriptional regulator [Psychrobacillus lasiicapitis]TQR14357.1 helix-turn-helix domain-containing protein [Psychrobacillus lasiicapitis]GGA32045.1 hypothetical protein GCM10011384_22030 [Psychrobacillus lasiicapitis]
MYDKEKFAELLIKGQGTRSLNAFAKDSGVSSAYISKLIRGLYETAPSPAIIKKIADTARDVSYGELMAAAGHILSLEESEKIRAKKMYLMKENPIYLALHPDIEERYKNLSGDEKKELDEFISDSTQDELFEFIRSLNYTSELEIMQQGIEESDMVVSEKVTNYKIKNSTYPYFPVSISAGLPQDVDAVMDFERIEIPDIVMGKWANNKDIYMMRINGESMNEIIPDDSLIAVKRTDLSNLIDGDVVVYSDDNSYSVKQFYRDNDRLIFRPASSDKRFTDYITTIDNENLKIYGKVVVYVVVND